MLGKLTLPNAPNFMFNPTKFKLRKDGNQLIVIGMFNFMKWYVIA